MGSLTDNAMKYIDAEKLSTQIEKLFPDSSDERIVEGFEYALDKVKAIIDSLQQEQTDFPITDEQIKEFLATHPKIEVPEKYKNPDWLFKKQEQSDHPSDLDEAAEEIVVKMHPCMEDCIILGDRLTRGELTALVKAGAELIISELFEKLKITPLKVIGKDEYGYPVYDFEVGHYYRTFTLFGEKYKCDQTDSGEAGEQMMAGQGYTTETKVDRTPLNGPAGICLNLHEYDGFKLGDRVIVQIRKEK